MRAFSALLFMIGTTLPAFAGDGFNVVIPGRPGVPIIINGVDASYRVIEGDRGLSRDVHVQPTVYGGRVYLGSDSGQVYALDDKTGCVHWSYLAAAGVRSAAATNL